MIEGVPLLETRALTKEFRRGTSWRPHVVRALDRVDFRLRAGESVGVVGESGSGKTTLVRCILRLISPTSGAVVFDGVDLSTLERGELRRRRREFQHVPQDPLGSMNPGMTVRSVLLEPFESHRVGTPKEREQNVAALLEAVTLDSSILNRFPVELSGGQQQRVVIARALALGPRLLVADEPVAALDPSVQAQVLNLLMELRRRRGLALLLVSHSLPVVARLCDRVVVMYRGRVVEEAPGREFFAGPHHPYSRLLMVCSSMAQGSESAAAREGEKGVRMKPGKTAGGCAFRGRCPEARPECGEKAPSLVAFGAGDSRVACFLYTQGPEQS